MQKEVLIYTYEEDGIPGVLSLLFLSAFSKKQRESIRDDRDEGKCQFPEDHSCGGGLEVHHIMPQRYAEWQGKDPDYAENGLTICSNSHDMIHPDRVKAKKTYHARKKRGEDSFKSLGQERDEKLRNKEKYWTDTWDRVLAVTALYLTRTAETRGWHLPNAAKK